MADGIMSFEEVMATVAPQVRWRAAWSTFRRARREGWLADAFARPSPELRLAIRVYADRMRPTGVTTLLGRLFLWKVGRSS